MAGIGSEHPTGISATWRRASGAAGKTRARAARGLRTRRPSRLCAPCTPSGGSTSTGSSSETARRAGTWSSGQADDDDDDDAKMQQRSTATMRLFSKPPTLTKPVPTGRTGSVHAPIPRCLTLAWGLRVGMDGWAGSRARLVFFFFKKKRLSQRIPHHSASPPTRTATTATCNDDRLTQHLHALPLVWHGVATVYSLDGNII